jgi:hypothetical protein
MPAAGHVAADTIERFYSLADCHARPDVNRERLEALAEGDALDVTSGQTDGLANLARDSVCCRAPRSLRYVEVARAGRVTEAARPVVHCGVSPAPDIAHDAARGTKNGRIACEIPRHQSRQGRGVRRFDDPHHNTILLSGYSTMPWARAALRRGISSRTVRSSMIVLTATHASH